MASFDIPGTGESVSTDRPIMAVLTLLFVGVGFFLLFLALDVGQATYNLAGELLPGELGGGPAGIPVRGAE